MVSLEIDGTPRFSETALSRYVALVADGFERRPGDFRSLFGRATLEHRHAGHHRACKIQSADVGLVASGAKASGASVCGVPFSAV